ncbi:PREDICTED: uncharacterized protein LOC108560766 isoform X2 [Nicrophorus vespilloides]|uniref:Uncharacterized protein LOC108560766 isoform X1 n=1 Tax=Nicrophorus vespilloides TaxID=110193 RepID=A0ABM1MH89_NICVS|nr:PREDICTED: uncharacterized protein LOC108560766 isoform X1 [Nicrophorus vespilloides]XP_017773939.1 PREDICTED: uncharacterized protein LOC108560766 isoform X2 [Nicrophorus vespilloides]
MFKITLLSFILASSFGLISADFVNDCNEGNLNFAAAIMNDATFMYSTALTKLAAVPGDLLDKIISCNGGNRNEAQLNAFGANEKQQLNRCNDKLALIKNAKKEVNQITQILTKLKCVRSEQGNENPLDDLINDSKGIVDKASNYMLQLVSPVSKESGGLIGNLLDGVLGKLFNLVGSLLSGILGGLGLGRSSKHVPITIDTIRLTVTSLTDDSMKVISSTLEPILSPIKGTWSCPNPMEMLTCLKISDLINNINSEIMESVENFGNCIDDNRNQLSGNLC